jgi:Multimeric flavodoxin WrbA
MKIVAVNASPLKNGNTSWCVNQILEGAKEQGAEAECFSFGDLDIKPCRGCLGCQRDSNSAAS